MAGASAAHRRISPNAAAALAAHRASPAAVAVAVAVGATDAKGTEEDDAIDDAMALPSEGRQLFSRAGAQ